MFLILKKVANTTFLPIFVTGNYILMLCDLRDRTLGAACGDQSPLPEAGD